MRIATTLIAAIGISTSLVGCAGVSGPDWFATTPVEVQRARDGFWDPYPDPRIAPDAAGVRPPDFSHPLPEADRTRWPFAPLR